MLYSVIYVSMHKKDRIHASSTYPLNLYIWKKNNEEENINNNNKTITTTMRGQKNVSETNSCLKIKYFLFIIFKWVEYFYALIIFLVFLFDLLCMWWEKILKPLIAIIIILV